MKNIIYQYWQGPMKPGVKYSTRLMKEYADSIGCEYRFDHNITIASKLVNIPIYYEPANPLVDEYFDQFDNIALVDIDVFPVSNLKEDVFHSIANKDSGICTEPEQPYFRQKYNVASITNANDKKWTDILKSKWSIEYSYDSNNRPKVFNTGVVIISKKGLAKIKRSWPSFQEYVNVMKQHKLPEFYSLFQDYFSAFIHYQDFEFQEIHNGWNSYMHKLGSHPTATINDTRTQDSKFVHVMFRRADDWPESALWDVTNKPVDQWNLPVNKEWPNDPV